MNKATVGQLVIATAGRDTNKKFIITCIIDDQYVYISDGDSRKLEKPKKKKLKHLKLIKSVSDEIAQAIQQEKKITNSVITKCIKSLDSYREQEV
jgi:large subunit ribosomal protein L14e